MKSESNLSVALAVLAGWMTFGVNPATAQYQQKNLVGFQKGMGHHTDPNL